MSCFFKEISWHSLSSLPFGYFPLPYGWPWLRPPLDCPAVKGLVGTPRGPTHNATVSYVVTSPTHRLVFKRVSFFLLQIYIFFFSKVVEASRWAVCYQRGLRRLVYCCCWVEYLTGETTSLLNVTFGHRFWIALSHITFGCHFWMSPLDITFRHHFWMSFLNVTFRPQFWT